MDRDEIDTSAVCDAVPMTKKKYRKSTHSGWSPPGNSRHGALASRSTQDCWT